MKPGPAEGGATPVAYAETLAWHGERPRIRPARLVVSWLVSALALLAAAYVVPGARKSRASGARFSSRSSSRS